MLNNETPPHIIKKIKKHGGHHGGAWKVAYADFVTAMMALFIVLWVMSQDQKVVKMVASYFKDPIGYSDKGKSILEGKSDNLLDMNLPKPVMQDKIEEMRKLKEMGDRILSELSADPKFNNLMGQIKIEMVKEGMRIEIVDSAKDLFFEIGTAKLKPEAVLLLRKIGDELAKIPNKIIVEGHTDARPYSGTNPMFTNFELSADRANSARWAMTSDTLSNAQIDQVRGYADRRLRDKKDPFNLVNRRISIIVKFSDNQQ